MGVVWVVDQPGLSIPEYALALMGNFPCRMIGSISSVCKLVKLQSHVRPNLLLINMAAVDKSPRYVREVLRCDLPATPIVLMFGDNNLAEDPLNWNAGIEPADVVTRVRSLLSETAAYQSSRIYFSTLSLDMERLTLQDTEGSFEESVTPKEAKILRLFVANKGRCVSREMIRKSVWNGAAVSARTIDSHISRLRKRLMITDIEIASIYGGGYILK